MRPDTGHPIEDDRLLLEAYLDGELDASASLRMEKLLETNAGLREEHDRLTALRSALRAAVPREIASEDFRNRIARISDFDAASRQMARAATRWPAFEWRRIAASVVVASVLASGATVWALRGQEESAAMGALVAEHRRMLLAAAPLDVESSDRHTVKPWFDAKLALSPQVVDLAADGYPLAGGRVEVVAGRLVPAMLYKHRNHAVSLVAVPHLAERDDPSAPTSTSQDGYTVLGWHGLDFDYFAISDIPPEELATFVAKWRETTR